MSHQERSKLGHSLGLAISVAIRDTPATFAHAKAVAALVDTAEAFRSMTPFERRVGIDVFVFRIRIVFQMFEILPKRVQQSHDHLPLRMNLLSMCAYFKRGVL